MGIIQEAKYAFVFTELFRLLLGYCVEEGMNYIAHCDGKREQTLVDHLKGTAERTRDFADKFDKGDWGYCCGILHDIGKYSDKFQRRIRGEEIRVDHATAGARECVKLGGMYQFLESCIAGHHTGLPDYGADEDSGNSPTLQGRRKKKIEDFSAYKFFRLESMMV